MGPDSLMTRQYLVGKVENKQSAAFLTQHDWYPSHALCRRLQIDFHVFTADRSCFQAIAHNEFVIQHNYADVQHTISVIISLTEELRQL